MLLLLLKVVLSACRLLRFSLQPPLSPVLLSATWVCFHCQLLLA
jgi:hypothetical protein